MKTIPATATDDDIREIVVEWSELLAAERYAEALAMFPYAGAWTPESLKSTIEGYGVIELDHESLATLHEEFETDRFTVTGLRERTDFREIFEKRIDVDREGLYGLNPSEYAGMVHYDDLPICGSRSDLTVRFHIKRIGVNEITLEFLDLHVM